MQAIFYMYEHTRTCMHVCKFSLTQTFYRSPVSVSGIGLKEILPESNQSLSKTPFTTNTLLYYLILLPLPESQLFS